MVPTHTPTATPRYNLIEPDNDCHDCPATRSSTPPRRSICLINTQWPSNISLQAIHYVMQLKATKLATKSQWTGPIINIKEVCFGVIHPATKQPSHNIGKGHLFIYLALAKPALPGQFVLLVSFQSKEKSWTKTVYSTAARPKGHISQY
jgi:hypothetical protein